MRGALTELSLIRRVAEAAAPGAVDLASGEPGHPTPPAVREALARAVEAGELGYTPNAGRQDLRRLLAARRPHHGGGPASALVTAGSQEALALVVLGLVEPGEEVVIPEPSYPSYEALPALAGARVLRCPPAEMARAISSRTRLAIVGSPANPTGAVLPAAAFDALAERAREAGCYLLSDEVYEEIYLGDRPPAYPEGRHVLHAGGISKSLAAPGLRLGWLVAPPGVVAALLPLHQHLVTCAPSLAQSAALAGLPLGAEEGEAIRALYRRRWQLLRTRLAEIEGISWRQPEGSYFAFVDVRERVSRPTAELAFDLARRGAVVVVPGEAFGPGSQGWIRLSFAVPEEAIREGSARLAAALAREAP